MTRLPTTALFALLVAGGAVATTAARTPGPSVQTSSFNYQCAEQLLSSAVVANWMAHRDAAGDLVLDLLVLWRGTPGWWLTGGSHSSGAGGGGSITRMVLNRGGKALTAGLDARTRMANVQGKDIKLGDANVVLVDEVDSADGPQISRTMTVDPKLPMPLRIDATILNSADLTAFIRCDVRLPDAATQAMIDIVCAPFVKK